MNPIKIYDELKNCGFDDKYINQVIKVTNNLEEAVELIK